MEFQVLGTFRVVRDDGAVEVSSPLGQRLLGMLLSRACESVPVDVLTEGLWPGETGDRTAAKLQVLIHRVRRSLDDPDRLAFGPGGYRLQVGPGELDVERFEELADQAVEVGTDPQRCADLAQAALALWQGEPFNGIDLPLLQDEALRLAERRLGLLEVLFQAELDRGRHTEVTADLGDLVRRHPLRERLAALLMTALYRAGRQADALQVYRGAHQRLVDDLGLDPGPELREVQRRILAGEDSAPHSAEAVRVPTQLPSPPRTFIGREVAFSELDQLLLAEHDTAPLCLISGTAGVGKSALALRWAQAARKHFPDGQLYLNLHGYGPQRPIPAIEALAGFLRALGVDATKIPDDLDERSAMFRSQVDGQKILVMLDNAQSAEQVRPLLPGSSSSFVLVTSRDSLVGLAARDGGQRIDLDLLELDDARALLRSLLGERVSDEPEASDALIERCAGLPLALRVAAELIRARGSLSVSELVAELADRQTRLDLLDLDGDPHTAVRTVFSWSYEHLPPEAARLFRLLGLHPGRDIELYALAALADLPVGATRRWLNVLVHAHLVEEGAERRLRLHDLLRDYALGLTEEVDVEGQRQAALDRLLDHYLLSAAQSMGLIAPGDRVQRPTVDVSVAAAPDPETYDDALRWLDRERQNLLASAECAMTSGRPRYVCDLSTILWRYLDDGNYTIMRLRLHQLALEGGQQLGDRAAQSDALRLLGQTRFDKGRYAEAEPLMRQALDVKRQLGDRMAEAALLNNLAGIKHVTGDGRGAIDFLEESLGIYRELDQLDLLINPLLNLGYVYGRLGERELALARIAEAQEVARALGDRRSQAKALLTLAKIHLRDGHTTKAIKQLEEALELSRSGGVHSLEGNVLCDLGTAHAQGGDFAAATECCAGALTIARDGDDGTLLARTLNSWGEVHTKSGAPDDAIRCYNEALERAVAGGLRYEEAKAHDGLGDVQTNAIELAVGHWRQALHIFRELDVPEVVEVEAKLDAHQ